MDLADRVDAALARIWAGDGTALRSLIRQGEEGENAGFDAGRFNEAIRALGGGEEAGLAPGTTLGEFTIHREIGRGGMGIVYEARQHSPCRSVALKVMRTGHAVHPRRVRLFRREIESLARLSHPGIAAIYGAGGEGEPAGRGGAQYYAMELVRGRPLQGWLRDDGGPPLRRRLELFVEVCDAIHAAHERGIVHRDIKPSNVMVDEDDRARVLDFGLARLQEGEGAPNVTLVTEAGQIVGTLPYMSPEQVAGDRSRIDRRTDVYALGVLLYEMLTGRLPFDFSLCPLPEAARIIRDEEPERPSSVLTILAGDLDVIITKALEKSPERRYQTGAELAEDLRRHLEHRPIKARPPTMRYRMGRYLRRNRGAAVGLGIAALAVVLGAAVTVTAMSLAWAARSEVRRTAAARRFGEYVSSVQAAYTAAKSDDLAGARALLAEAPEGHRGWEWTFLSGMLDAGGRGAEQVPVAEGAWAGITRDSAFRRRADGDTELVPFGGGAPVALGQAQGQWRLAVTTDRRYAISVRDSAEGKVEVVDLSTGETVAALEGLVHETHTLAIDEARARVALGGSSGVLKFFTIPDLAPDGEITFPGSLGQAEFSPDSANVAVSYWPSGLRVCRLSDGATVVECDTRGGMPQYPDYSPDGRFLVSLNDRELNLNLWDAATGAMLRRVIIAEGPMCLAVIGDSGRLAVGCADGTLRVFAFGSPDGMPWAPLLTFKEGPECISFLASARDGSWIYADRRGASGLVWRCRPVGESVAGAPPRSAAREPGGFAAYVGAVRAAQSEIAGGDVGGARRRLESAPAEHRGWEWRYLRALCSPRRGEPGMGGLRRSERELMVGGGTSRTLMADRDRGTMNLTDPATLEVVASVGGFGREQPDRVAFTDDGAYCLSVYHGALRAHRTDDGSQAAERFDLNHQDWVFLATPDSRRLVMGGRDGITRVLEIATLAVLEEHAESGAVWRGDVSRDGSTVALVIEPGVLRFRRLADWSLVQECAPLPCPPDSLLLTADGEDLYALTTCDRSLIEISARTGLVERRTGVPGNASLLCLFPDDSRLAVGCTDGSVLIYPRLPPEGAAWEPILSLREHGSNINSIWMSLDGRCLSADLGYQPDLIWDAGPGADEGEPHGR